MGNNLKRFWETLMDMLLITVAALLLILVLHSCGDLVRAAEDGGQNFPPVSFDDPVRPASAGLLISSPVEESEAWHVPLSHTGGPGAVVVPARLWASHWQLTIDNRQLKGRL